MKKKILAIISVFLLAAVVAGCGSSATGSSAGQPLKIGIPDDATNGGRAIKLLEGAGLIEVDPAAGWTPELKDITKYIYNIEIVPVQANTLPSTLDDFAGAVINGTYATSANLSPSQDGLIIESQNSDGAGNPFVNIVAVRTAELDNELYKTLIEAFQSDIVAQYLVAKYKEAYLPAFASADTGISDEDLLAEIDGYRSSPDGKAIIRLGVCGSSNDQWKAAQKVLDDTDAGIYIELVEFDAYNLPNEALNSGDIDLNSFQHKAYLANEIASQGYDIAILGDTIIAPLTLYSSSYDSVDAIKDAAGLK